MPQFRDFAGSGCSQPVPQQSPTGENKLSFLSDLDGICQQFATAIQNSEIQLYVSLAVIVLLTTFMFPPKNDPDQA
jgi:hypothetical protein